jgi:hypothetical protein
MPLKKLFERLRTTMKQNNERGARQSVIEDLFYDFNRSRVQVYKMNFVRGILFGAGSVIGGTVVIALIVWILSLLGSVIPPLGDFFDGVSNTLDASTR